MAGCARMSKTVKSSQGARGWTAGSALGLGRSSQAHHKEKQCWSRAHQRLERVIYIEKDPKLASYLGSACWPACIDREWCVCEWSVCVWGGGGAALGR